MRNLSLWIGLRYRMGTLNSGQQLTPRQLEVARGVAEGLTDEEIGARLGLTRSTVRLHLTGAFQRLGLKSRTALAVWWVSGAQKGHLPNGRI